MFSFLYLFVCLYACYNSVFVPILKVMYVYDSCYLNSILFFLNEKLKGQRYNFILFYFFDNFFNYVIRADKFNLTNQTEFFVNFK